jgi:hypothetical protein
MSTQEARPDPDAMALPNNYFITETGTGSSSGIVYTAENPQTKIKLVETQIWRGPLYTPKHLIIPGEATPGHWVLTKPFPTQLVAAVVIEAEAFNAEAKVISWQAEAFSEPGEEQEVAIRYEYQKMFGGNQAGGLSAATNVTKELVNVVGGRDQLFLEPITKEDEENEEKGEAGDKVALLLIAFGF